MISNCLTMVAQRSAAPAILLATLFYPAIAFSDEQMLYENYNIQYDDLISKLSETHNLYPADFGILFVLASLRYQNGAPKYDTHSNKATYNVNELEAALRLFERAAILKPAEYLPHLYIGHINSLAILKGTGPKSAIPHYQEALKRYSKDIRVYDYLGFSYIHASQYNDAIAILSDALKLDASNANILHKLAIAHLSLGKYGESIEYCTRIEPLRQDSSVIAVLAISYLKAGDYTNANNSFERLIRMDPKSIAGLSGLSMTALKKGDATKALNYIESAIKYYPDDKELQKKKIDIINALQKKQGK